MTRTYSIRQTDRQRYEIRTIEDGIPTESWYCLSQAQADYLVHVLSHISEMQHLTALKASVAKADERNASAKRCGLCGLPVPIYDCGIVPCYASDQDRKTA